MRDGAAEAVSEEVGFWGRRGLSEDAPLLLFCFGSLALLLAYHSRGAWHTGREFW